MQLAKHWRLKSQRYRLEAVRNRETGEVHFPPPAVTGPQHESMRLSGLGEVWSLSEIRNGMEEFGGSYIVALVKLAEGPLVTAQLTDIEPSAARIGLPVEMVTRKLRDLGPEGLLVYGYKFRPRLEDAAPPSELTPASMGV